MIPKLFNHLCITACILALSACSLFEPHKMPIQQGNIVTQKMIDQLQPGMSKAQVKFILGSPLLLDPLHTNQWHYAYSIHLGTELLAKYQLILHFEDEKLSAFEGDFKPTEPTAEKTEPRLTTAQASAKPVK